MRSSTEETKADLKKVIDALLECEQKGANCRKCKKLKRGCLVFMRDGIAVALQFILSGMDTPEPPDTIYQ
ncbi:hypothetical protein LCGC14_2656470 [marine sediment metagenome]|uniref:Uncharacterized protein n=1 Tax=marine sediment metagenome TaxID=412755 RepID=A0A0F9CKA8_9ZZZZ